MNITTKANQVWEKTFDNMKECVRLLKEELKKPKTQQNTAQVFKWIRVYLGMTQKEFAILLGVSSKSISRWELGIHIPELTFEQYTIIAYELHKVGIDLMNLDCYFLKATPSEIKTLRLNSFAAA
jgi:DNA-binding transcriptional regulator YiaG